MEGAMVITQYFHIPRARLALRRFGTGFCFPRMRASSFAISSRCRAK
jgi:hypothetical protein